MITFNNIGKSGAGEAPSGQRVVSVFCKRAQEACKKHLELAPSPTGRPYILIPQSESFGVLEYIAERGTKKEANAESPAPL